MTSDCVEKFCKLGLNEANTAEQLTAISSLIQRTSKDWLDSYLNGKFAKLSTEQLKRNYAALILSKFNINTSSNQLVDLLINNFVNNNAKWDKFPDGIDKNLAIMSDLANMVYGYQMLEPYLK